VARPDASPTRRQLGIGVEPLTPEIARQLQITGNVQGLVVSEVDPNGPASTRLTRGDVITAVLGASRQQQLRTIDDLRDAIARSSGVLSLLVYSPQARGTRVVNVPLAR
jgi:serine protease Do